MQGSTLVFASIYNPLPGKLTISGNPSAGYVVYDQNYLPSITIVNRTDVNVQLAAITTENVNYLNPSINGRIKGVTKSSGIIPVISIESRGAGNVVVAGLIANPKGTVSFLWTDSERAGGLFSMRDTLSTTTLTAAVAPVWAHILNVMGAASVGGVAGSATRFNVYST